MNNGHFYYPLPINEPILQYAPLSVERKKIQEAIQHLKKQTLEIPLYIGKESIITKDKLPIYPPHELSHLLGYSYQGNTQHLQQAIDAALAAKSNWETLPWENRANIFLKAADLLANKYRFILNAATMLGQSKNVFQAEIDSACEFIDFLRFNVFFLNQIYQQQPIQAPGIHNRIEWRALEGFVLAISPFNFTAIGGNLPISAALCGNTVIWKPADTQVYAAHFIMKILFEAGLPHGVINMVPSKGIDVSEVCVKHPQLAGIHFTGSTKVFQDIWKTVGNHIHSYKTYPRLVGETGGKDFILAHSSADIHILATAIIRGAFEYQGQKCSAASRAYIPSNLAPLLKKKLIEEIAKITIGNVEDTSHFMNAVIDEKSFDKITQYIQQAKTSKDATILIGGGSNKTKGYFIEPTVIETKDPYFITMCEEIFGPVLTLYTYPENEFEKTIELVNHSSTYALTGAIISQDRYAVDYATKHLANAAGNFYINDKPTGAVVGQQPFGGARASGTNDKAGSMLNLYRWLSARTIKETYNPATDFAYPFMQI